MEHMWIFMPPCIYLGWPYLQKCLVKFLVKLDLKFENSEGNELVNILGKTFLPARKALETSGEFRRTCQRQFWKLHFTFCIFFSETSFSRSAMLTFTLRSANITQFATASASHRIENPEIQKIPSKKRDRNGRKLAKNRNCLLFLCHFCSYFLHFRAFPFCRWPTQSQRKRQ